MLIEFVTIVEFHILNLEKTLGYFLVLQFKVLLL